MASVRVETRLWNSLRMADLVTVEHGAFMPVLSLRCAIPDQRQRRLPTPVRRWCQEIDSPAGFPYSADVIADVRTKSLKMIPDERGQLMEILRCDDELFTKFGQVYVTTTYPGVVKAWHYHRLQTDHFACLRGMIKLVLFDNRESSPTKREVDEFFIGDSNRLLVSIPAGVYHGFKGIGTEEAMVLNIPTEAYNYKQPDEYRLPPHDPLVPYDWALKEG